MSTRKSSTMARRPSKAAEAPTVPTRTRSGAAKAGRGEPDARQLAMPLPPGVAAPATSVPIPAAPESALASPGAVSAPAIDPHRPIRPRLTSLPSASGGPPLADQAASTVARHLSELRTALADGWEIVQPIFARPLWSAPDDSATAFNFVLRRSQGTRLITVPGGRTVERFIRDRHLTVDYAR